jgi:hypothetical protein
VIGCPEEAIARSQINGRRVSRIVVDREQKGMVVAHMRPLASRGPNKESAWGKLRSHHIFSGAAHARIENSAAEREGRCHDQEKEVSPTKVQDRFTAHHFTGNGGGPASLAKNINL